MRLGSKLGNIVKLDHYLRTASDTHQNSTSEQERKGNRALYFGNNSLGFVFVLFLGHYQQRNLKIKIIGGQPLSENNRKTRDYTVHQLNSRIIGGQVPSLPPLASYVPGHFSQECQMQSLSS